jgi:hypothetical protein
MTDAALGPESSVLDGDQGKGAPAGRDANEFYGSITFASLIVRTPH